MKVELIACTEEPLNLVEIATKLRNENKNQDVDSIIENNIENCDFKDFYNVYFSFIISGVSSAVETYMISHRISNFSVDSKTKYTQDDIEWPNFQFNVAIDNEVRNSLVEKYKELCQETIDTYNYLIANNIPYNDASYVLPNSLKHDVLITGNVRQIVNLINDAKLGRESKNDEIVDLGNKLYECINSKFSKYFDKILRKCEFDKNDNIDKLNQLLEIEGICCDITDKNAKQQVELITYTEDAEKVVGISALIARINCSTEYAKVKVNDTDFLKKLLDIICTESAARELEMVNYTFRLNNLTFSTLRKILSNKIGAVCIQTISQTEKSKYHVIPDSIENSENKELIEKYNDIFEQSIELYNEFKENELCEQYKMYIYLKGDYMMDAIVTMNARQLYDFFKTSSSLNISEDIKTIAHQMLEELNNVSPFIFFSACEEDSNNIY